MTITFGHTGSHRAKEDNLRDNFIKKVHKLFPPQNIIRNGIPCVAPQTPKNTTEEKLSAQSSREFTWIHDDMENNQVPPETLTRNKASPGCLEHCLQNQQNWMCKHSLIHCCRTSTGFTQVISINC